MLSTALLLTTSIAIAQPEEPTAADYLKFMSYQVGKWNIEYEDGSTGECVIEMSPTNACIVGCVKKDGKPGSHLMAAYNPESKMWEATMVGAEGWRAEISMEVDKATLTAPRRNVKIMRTLRVVSPDGIVDENEQLLTIVDDDTWQIGSGDDVIKLRRK
jgi:hypothetical protein